MMKKRPLSSKEGRAGSNPQPKGYGVRQLVGALGVGDLSPRWSPLPVVHHWRQVATATKSADKSAHSKGLGGKRAVASSPKEEPPTPASTTRYPPFPRL